MAFDMNQLMQSPWLNMGLGILGANRPGASFGEAVGQGGLLGIQNYQAQLKYQQEQDELKRMLAAQAKVAEMSPEIGPILQAYPNAAPQVLGSLYKSPSDAPSNVREWQYFSQLPEAEQQQYLTMKRANQWLDQGGYNVMPSPLNPMAPMAVLPKSLPPQDLPQVRGAQAQATTQAQEDVKREFNVRSAQPKAFSALNTFKRQTGVARAALKDVASLYDPTIPLTPNFFAMFPTKLKSIENRLKTVKANIGFQALQEMRNNSPTGGALGQVAVQELEGLQATLGALDPKDPQFLQTLQSVDAILAEMESAAEQAYSIDYGAKVQPGAAGGTAAPGGGGFRIIGESK